MQMIGLLLLFILKIKQPIFLIERERQKRQREREERRKQREAELAGSYMPFVYKIIFLDKNHFCFFLLFCFFFVLILTIFLFENYCFF